MFDRVQILGDVSYVFVQTYSDGTENEVLQLHVRANGTVATYVADDEPSSKGTYDSFGFLKRISP